MSIPLSNSAFRDAVAEEFEIGRSDHLPSRILDLCVDEFGLYRLAMVCQQFMPGYWLPEQLDLEQATFGDLYYYLEMALEQSHAGPRMKFPI